MKKYFITNASLNMFEVGNQLDLEGFGFSTHEVSLAAKMGFQQMDGDNLISILPIADEELLSSRIGSFLNTTDTNGFYYHIITEAEAIAERDRLKAVNDANAAERANTPTDDDIFRAQQLKLLTEINIKLGGGANV